MMHYFLAENVTPGGGVQYLVARAINQSECLHPDSVVSLEVAKYHFLKFSQYTSMSDSQRVRQVAIDRAAAFSYASDVGTLDTHFPLTYEGMKKLYGRDNKHTIWNNLPTPTVENLDGIAYVNPLHACQFLFGFAIEMDDFYVNKPNGLSDNYPGRNQDDPLVLYISDSCTARDMASSVAEISNGEPALLAWATDWRDGFSANRVKTNRKSTIAWTFSLSTPKARVNSSDNTVPIALGLKSNKNWSKVEHRFRDDMRVFGDGLSPIRLYHGGLKKIVPVYVKRIACLADKIEKAALTYTLSPTSTLHRCFGKIIELMIPILLSGKIDEYITNLRNGANDTCLKKHGWSNQFYDPSVVTNAAKLVSCVRCRQETIDYLRQCSSRSTSFKKETCCDCANWRIEDDTAGMLLFDPPSDYPKFEKDGCLIRPPSGREVGLSKLRMIRLDFATIVQAIKYAFCNSMGRKSWNKKNCQAYLRCCGVNEEQQNLVYDKAQSSHASKAVIDYSNEKFLGQYEYPAAFTGDLELSFFIETLMHLLFLGNAKYNFELCKIYMRDVRGGNMEPKFKRNCNRLLYDLKKFNLSWLLSHEFAGKKLTTGPWVSENWLAWVRLSKILYGWFGTRGIQDERDGVNDLFRMIISFTAMVACVLTHSGFDKRKISIHQGFVREYLSCVNELDIRLRHKIMSSPPMKICNQHNTKATSPRTGGTGTVDIGNDATNINDDNCPDPQMIGKNSKSKKQNKINQINQSKEPWWYKSNYLSLLNLERAIVLLGPLINLWDGGGKGEVFIQFVKPLIPRGVRDCANFFTLLTDKHYKMRAIQLIENSWPEMSNFITNHFISQSGEEMRDQETCQNILDRDDSEISSHSGSEMSTGFCDDTIYCQSADSESDCLLVSEVEDSQMSKPRTIYTYRTRRDLENALRNCLPIAGVVVMEKDTNKPLHFALYKLPQKKIGWTMLVFDDKNGRNVCGTWYSATSVVFDDDRYPPTSAAAVPRLAKMSVVSVPMKYLFDEIHVDGEKRCVISNWWKERCKDGNYRPPNLDFELYVE